LFAVSFTKFREFWDLNEVMQNYVSLFTVACTSVIFVLTYFLVLVLVAVFEIFFSFSFVLVFIIFSF